MDIVLKENIYLVKIVNKDALNKAINHLHNDADIHPLILKYERPKFKVPDKPFIALPSLPNSGNIFTLSAWHILYTSFAS